MTDTPTTAERILEVDAELATLTGRRHIVSKALEDAVVADKETAGLCKDLSRLDSSIELAQTTRRGLERKRQAEERETLEAGVAEAQQFLTDAETTLRDTLARREAVFAELRELDERLVIRAQIERDNAITRFFRRRDALTKSALEEVTHK